MRTGQFQRGPFPSSVTAARPRSDIYETKASEVKEVALQLHEPEARSELVTLARGYELLAECMRSLRRRET
jgi:hypothetical protein